VAYDANIPNEANQVRTTSGDLAKMQGNFAALSGVATLGVDGISGADVSGRVEGDLLQFRNTGWGRTDVDADGALTAGALLRWRTAGGADRWVASGLAMDDLTDVNAPAPTSGQILKFDGANWVASADEGVAGSGATTSGFILVSWAQMQLSGLYTISGGVYATVTGFHVPSALASGALGAPAFTLSAEDGTITVPSGIELIRVIANAMISGSGANINVDLEPAIDGAPLTTYRTRAPRRTLTASEGEHTGFVTPFLTVTGGEVITLLASGNVNGVLHSGGTSFIVEGYQVSGIGGGGSETFAQVMLRLPSGVNQTLTNNSQVAITGMELIDNVGCFAVLPASGIIELPSGYTHFQAFLSLRYEANGTGDRRAGLLFDGTANAVSGGGQRVLAIQPVVAAGTTPHFVTLVSPLLDLIPGTQLQMTGRQGSGGDLDVEWGSVGGAGAEHDTYFTIRAFNLTDAVC